MRVLGIDLGRSRTGLALSDPVGVTCRPFAIVAERDEHRLLERILEAATEQEVGMIVVGLPRPLSGGGNSQTAYVLDFVERLRADATIRVDTWDERFTTQLAERGRPAAEASDAVAACYMLQNYLDARSKMTEGE